MRLNQHRFGVAIVLYRQVNILLLSYILIYDYIIKEWADVKHLQVLNMEKDDYDKILDDEIGKISIEARAKGFAVSQEVLYKTDFTRLIVHAFHIPKEDGVIHHFGITLYLYKRKRKADSWKKVKVIEKTVLHDENVNSLKIDCGRGLAVKNLTEFLNAQFKAIGQKIEKKKVIIDNPEDFDFSIIKILDKSKLEDIGSLVSAKNLENILIKWEDNRSNNNEEDWQQIFQSEVWILSQVFASPFIQIGKKFYCGGKEDDDKGGVKGDLMYQNQLTGNIAFIEIKTPETKIIGNKYRGDEHGRENVIYGMSNDLTGGVVQVLNQRKVYISTHGDHDGKFINNGKCILIIGKINKLIEDEKKSLELYRSSCKEVEIITYDELFGRIQSFLNVLKKD